MDKILMIIGCSLLAVIFFASAIIAYYQIVKSNRTYTTKKGQNGDVHLDEICSKYLKLTNQYKSSKDRGDENLD